MSLSSVHSSALGTSRLRLGALAAYAASGVALIPFAAWVLGLPLLLLCLVLARRDPDPAFLRRMAVLAGCNLLLAFAPIHTDTSTSHIAVLASCFLAVIAVPYLILRRTDPGVIRYRWFPRRLRKLDLFYVFISIPLAWAAFELYFGVVSPHVPGNWTLPPEPSNEENWRLFLGINGVGIWDELFFINTVYAVLRSVFPYRWANLGQAVIYTAVLYDMAFRGLGPWLIYPFALTQGAMFEESESLVYVILVHLIVDAFLFAGILAYYYPGGSWFLN